MLYDFFLDLYRKKSFAKRINYYKQINSKNNFSDIKPGFLWRQYQQIWVIYPNLRLK